MPMTREKERDLQSTPDLDRRKATAHGRGAALPGVKSADTRCVERVYRCTRVFDQDLAFEMTPSVSLCTGRAASAAGPWDTAAGSWWLSSRS